LRELIEKRSTLDRVTRLALLRVAGVMVVE
jgi:hypothetical protein